MCLIILQTKAKIEVEKKKLVFAYNNNPDGCGIAAIDGGVLKIWKGMPTFASFYKTYLEVCELDSPVLVHFRVGTQGEMNINNLHPFQVYEDMVFAHNGQIRMPMNDFKSDTRLFCDDILKHIPRAAYQQPGVWRMMHLAVGKSCLAFMFASGETYIVNEYHNGDGHWNKKHTVWYSNNSYDQPNWFEQFNKENTTCYTCSSKLRHQPDEMIQQTFCETCMELPGKDE